MMADTVLRSSTSVFLRPFLAFFDVFHWYVSLLFFHYKGLASKRKGPTPKSCFQGSFQIMARVYPFQYTPRQPHFLG